MPLKRRTTRRVRASRAPEYTIQGSISHLAKRAYEGVQFLKGIVNAEKKEYQTNAGGNPDTSGIINSLTSIPAGVDNGQRNGNSIKVVGLYIRGMIRGIAGNTRITRVMVVMDKQNTGTNPVPEDIIDGLTTTNYAILSPLDSDKMVRWKVLFDRNFVTDDAQGQVKTFNKYIKLNHHIHYTGTTANDLYTGQVYMLLVGADTTNAPGVVTTCRTYFYDN